MMISWNGQSRSTTGSATKTDDTATGRCDSGGRYYNHSRKRMPHYALVVVRPVTFEVCVRRNWSTTGPEYYKQHSEHKLCDFTFHTQKRQT